MITRSEKARPSSFANTFAPPATLFSLALFLTFSTHATITIHPWTPIYQGIDFTTGEADASEPRRHQVAALRIDLTDPTIQFFSTPSNGDAPRETFGQTTTTFVETYGVAVGVNANFFSPVNTTPNDPRDLSGLAVSLGEVVSTFENGRPAVTVTRSNKVSIVASAPSNPSNIWTAVAGSDRLVLQGANTADPGCTTSFCGPNPRTAVGVSQDNRYFYMIVIDGRQPGWSDGATLVETGDWLLRIGAWNGLNLDGGGSSAMARLQGSSAVLLNRPSGGSVLRVNGNHLGVFALPLVPKIVSHPQSLNVNAGSNATFLVSATGPTLSYRWRFNGTPIAGATASSYTRTNVQAMHAGNYSVVVSNASGTVASSNALLTLNQPPLITAHPTARTALKGQPTVFTVTASGTAPMQYLWRFNGSPIAGATAASFTVAAIQTTNNGEYSVLVTNIAGTAVSSNARLTVVDIGAWGENNFGQLNVPSDGTNVVAVAAGSWHSLALRRNGSITAWGNNWSSQCNVPLALTNAVAISAGGYHNFAITDQGSLIGWGANDYGQLNASPALRNIIAVSAGTWHTLALTRSGQPLAWGDNAYGQTNVLSHLTNIIAIAAGGAHSLALHSDGLVHAWGANTDAVGNFVGQSITPPGLSNVIQIAAGGYHSLALLESGTVVAWGDNSQNQCSVPVGVTEIVAIDAGASHSLALRSDGTVVAWGGNWSGPYTLPTTLTNIIAVAGGERHTIVLAEGTEPNFQLFLPGWEELRFGALIQTLNLRDYVLEFKNSLSETSWQSLPSISGNGALRLLFDPGATPPQRVYRVRLE